jgi:hypothetical protein
MPDKITPKNLSYDQTLPPFLARLRGQQSTDTQGPDPILAARRRPGRVRSASEEAEDAPVVVDEEGNVLQLKGGQPGTGDDEAPLQGEGGERDKVEEPKTELEKVAGIGAVRKRKIGRVVGARDEDEDKAGLDSDTAKAVKATRALTAQEDNASPPPPKPKGGEKGDRSAKKKAKKIKLSFGDDDG